MSSPSVITLRDSKELKERLVSMADQQGVSMNQLLTYFLTEKVTAMEMNEDIKKRLKRIEKTSILELQNSATDVLDSQRQLEPHEIPDWDKFPIKYETPEESRPNLSVNEDEPTYDTDSNS